MKDIHKKRFINVLLLAVGICFVFGGIVFAWLATVRLPDFKAFEERRLEASTKIYDKTGEVILFDLNENIRRTVVPIAEMGINIQNATIAIEDVEFYQHNGIRIKSIMRAIWANIRQGGASQGGSTITQQIVKNTLLTQEKKISRKIKEWILALKVEQSMTKEQILEVYLNDSSYGGNMYGIYQASKTYFGKEPLDLTIAESAYLASIPNSPSRFSPYGKNLDLLENRKNLILSRMRENGFINEEEYQTAKIEVVTFKPQEPYSIKAPHFVFYIKDQLIQKYGEDVVEAGGMKIITTLDYELQKKAEEVIKRNALENEKNFNASNSALVALDPKTGDILAMVGSRDYFDKNIDGNFNVAIASRQPGSSFKPIVYATGFEKGYSDKTILFDVPTQFSSACNAYGTPLPGHTSEECYMPDNFDNGFRGPMSLRNALAQSINVPAVKMLYLVGLEDALKTARAMGIQTLGDKDRYGLSLVLGGGEVTPLDMTSAYGVLANNGTRATPRSILRIEDGRGTIIEETKIDLREGVISKNSALMVSDILSDNVARTPTFGANSFLNFPDGTVAGKTGTTNNNRDAWVMGYTPSVVVGVWSGNNDNKSMKKGSGVSGPAWSEIMREVIKLYPSEPFEKPIENPALEQASPVMRGLWQGGESFEIDRISGKLATEFTPTETREERVLTNVQTILYWINKDNPLGPSPSNPNDDPQFNRWSVAVQNWWNSNRGRYATLNSKPVEYDSIHRPEFNPRATIMVPVEGQSVRASSVASIEIQVAPGTYPLGSTDVFINDYFVGSMKQGSTTYSFIPSSIPSIRENNELRLIVKDSVYNKTELRTQFSVI